MLAKSTPTAILAPAHLAVVLAPENFPIPDTDFAVEVVLLANFSTTFLAWQGGAFLF